MNVSIVYQIYVLLRIIRVGVIACIWLASRQYSFVFFCSRLILPSIGAQIYQCSQNKTKIHCTSSRILILKSILEGIEGCLYFLFTFQLLG